MDKPISSLMEKHVKTVDTDDSVDRVEEILRAQKLSCVPVVDAMGQCFGVISATDLLHFHAMRRNQKSERAWEVCSHKVIEVNPDISITEAAELMVSNKIHHLVVTEEKSIKGIVSSIDLVKACLSKQKA